MFLYRRGIFIIDRYILYSSYDFRFTPSTQYLCTDVVYLLLTGTFCIRLMTFVSPPVLNVSVQTWYIYYWHVHFVFVLWLSFHPSTQCFCTDVVYLLLTCTFCIRRMTFVSPQYSMFLYRRGKFIIDRYILYSSYIGVIFHWYGTDYPSAAYELISGHWWDSCCISVIFSICWRGNCLFLSFVIVFAACLSWLVLTSDFATFVSPLGLNVSVQTWYIYYWQVHFVNNVITIKT